jgi:hypothetical protein
MLASLAMMMLPYQGGVSAGCSRFSRDGFDSLFVDKKHLARIERPSSLDRRVIFVLTASVLCD